MSPFVVEGWYRDEQGVARDVLFEAAGTQEAAWLCVIACQSGCYRTRLLGAAS